EALGDPGPEVGAAALERLAAASPERAIDRAVVDIRDPDPTSRLAAGRALGSAGGGAMSAVLDALRDRRTADAAVEAIRHMKLDGDGDGDRVRQFIRSAVQRAQGDRVLAGSIRDEDDAARFLRDAIL